MENVFTKEKFWIEDKNDFWDLYVYVPKMWSYYHIYRASDRAGICEYMTRRHLAGTIKESVA